MSNAGFEPRIELARGDDLPELILLCADDPHAPRWTQAQLLNVVLANAQSHESPCRIAFVARTGDHVAGFCVCSHAGDEAELEAIVVDQAHRRLGIGQQLLRAAEAWALEQRAEALRLEVRQSNAAARSFYSAENFLRAGERLAYYRDPVESAVLLTKALPHGKP